MKNDLVSFFSINEIPKIQKKHCKKKSELNI